MRIEVDWRKIRSVSDDAWDWTRVLYAYAHEGDLLYIGRVHGATSSVWTRWWAPDKDRQREVCERVYGRRRFDVLVGRLSLERGKRMSAEVLSDVESLLIKRLQPTHNTQCRRSRISRPGMRVVCFGQLWRWPDEFRDA